MQRMLYTVSDAAETLSLTPQTVYRLISGGRLRAVRYGRKVLLPASELSRFVRELVRASGGGKK